MFSFLPLTYREKVKKEYNLRLWASFCLMLGCVSLVSAVLVFPAYLSAKSAEVLAATGYAAATKDLASLGDQGAQTNLASAKTYMGALEALVPLNADVVVSSIVSVKPKGVSITSISIGNTDSGVEISVGGIAATRDGLIAFSHALQNVSGFSNIVFPVDDLAQDTNIDYTISLSTNSQSQ